MGTWTEPAWLDALLKTGAIIMAASILYVLIMYFLSARIIFKTTAASGKYPKNAFSYYYLPAPLLKITALAKAEICTDAGGIVQTAELKELSITVVSGTMPDTSQLLLLQYCGSSFSNDDVKIGTTEQGLLDNVSAVTEDRFTQMIAALFAAPKTILQNDPGRADAVPAANCVIKEYTKEFYMAPDKIKDKAGEVFTWNIDVPGNPVNSKPLDASFKIDMTSPFSSTSSTVMATSLPGNGIYVRPQVTLQMSVSPGNSNSLHITGISTAFITVPDITKAVLVPVTRSMMVKKTQTLKLQNGMLLENAVAKPSETEALVSVPVNMLKAIFSIPAQLLSFRISHVQQQKTFVTEEAGLSKAKLDSEKAKLGTEAELAKAKLDAQKTLAAYEQELLKAKMETQKALLNAEKDTIASQKDIVKAQQDLLQAQQDLAELRKKINPAVP